MSKLDISKYIQDIIQDIHKIPSGGGAAPPGPAPAPACYFEYLRIFLHILDIFGHIFGIMFRLQLKRGLFWYRLYPKLHQMVKYGSSRAIAWTIRRHITLRVFFIKKKLRKMTIWSKRTRTCWFSWKQIFEKLHASHQNWKKLMPPILSTQNWLIWLSISQFN